MLSTSLAGLRHYRRVNMSHLPEISMKFTRLIAIANSLNWFIAGLLAFGLAGCSNSGGDHHQETTTLAATLAGSQEVPRTPTTATGTGTLSLDLPSRAIRGSSVVSGMTATMAHIHVDVAGVNGFIVVDLTQTSPGTWSVPPGATLT